MKTFSSLFLALILMVSTAQSISSLEAEKVYQAMIEELHQTYNVKLEDIQKYERQTQSNAFIKSLPQGTSFLMPSNMTEALAAHYKQNLISKALKNKKPLPLSRTIDDIQDKCLAIATLIKTLKAQNPLECTLIKNLETLNGKLLTWKAVIIDTDEYCDEQFTSWKVFSLTALKKAATVSTGLIALAFLVCKFYQPNKNK